MNRPRTLQRDYIVSRLQSEGVLAAAALLAERQPIVLLDSEGRPDIDQIALRYGIAIREDRIGAAGMLALAKHDWEAICNAANGPVENRYTLAHELGHWLLHHKFGIDGPQAREFGIFDLVEQVCDVFASLTLIPPQTAARCLSQRKKIGFQDLENLARQFLVPIRAVLHSIKASGLLIQTGQGVVVYQPATPSGTLHVVQACTALGPKITTVAASTADALGFRQIAAAWSRFPQRKEFNLIETCVLPVLHTFEVVYKIYESANERVFIVGIFSERPHELTASG